jgi:hypothetical protein
MIIWLMPVSCCVPKPINTHSDNTLIFHGNNGCTNAPKCFVVRTLRVLLLHSVVNALFRLRSFFFPFYFFLSFFLPSFLPSFLSSQSSECWRKRKAGGLKLSLEESEGMLSGVPLPVCLLTGTCTHLSFGGVIQAHEKWKTISNTHVSVMSVFITTDLEWESSSDQCILCR